jgi:hypothetical protein
MDLPIICTLTEEELKERRRTILDAVGQSALKVTSLPDGYVYSFEASSEILHQLTRLIDLERQCCPFLTFKVIVQGNGQPIRLEVTGPPAAKPIIAEFLGN